MQCKKKEEERSQSKHFSHHCSANINFMIFPNDKYIPVIVASVLAVV